MSDWNDEDLQESDPGLPAFLTDPKGVLQRRWVWMLSATILGIVATLAVVSLQRPMYDAVAKVLIKRQRIPENLVRSTVEEDTLQVINGLLGEVLSQARLSELIDANGLYLETREEQPISEVVGLMRSRIAVVPEQGLRLAKNDEARIVAISFEDANPRTSAKIANAIAHDLTDASLRNRSEQARITTEFLRRELENSKRQLQEQNRLITEFQEKYRGELPDELDTNLRRLERAQDQRHSLAIQISEAESRLASLMVAVQAEELKSGATPEARLADLKTQLKDAESLYTDKHPEVISLRRRIAALENSATGDDQDHVSTTVDRSGLVDATKSRIALLRKQLREIEDQMEDLDGRVARTPSRKEEFDALTQKATVLNESYTTALRKVKEAELAQDLESAQQGARLSVVDPARPPRRTNGKRLKYGLLGIIASIGMAIGLGFFLEILDPVVLTSDQVGSFCGGMALGSIPRI